MHQFIKRFIAAVILLFALSVSIATHAVAAEGNTIAILDFKPNNASSGEAVAITGFVRSAFIRAGAYTVVDKTNMDRIMNEQAFQQTGCTDQTCAVKLGKLLNVKKMVVGEYTMMGTVRFLTASLVDVETGKMERTGKVKGFEPGNADEAAEKIAAELMGTPEVQMSASPVVDTQAQAQAEEARRKADAEAAKEAAKKEKERIKAEREAAKALEPVDTRVARGRFGIGLNTPGVGLRALIGNRWMVEARGQYEKEATAIGVRLYRYIFSSNRIYPYLGVEVDPRVKYYDRAESIEALGTFVEPLVGSNTSSGKDCRFNSILDLRGLSSTRRTLRLDI